MEATPRTVRTYVSPEGHEPFREWLLGLKDKKLRAAVRARIDRLRSGNFGDHRRLTSDLFELRIHYGAGYRVYFSDNGEEVMLLDGGSKGTQQRDIQKAQEYLEEFTRR